jgi:hypothetical protein
MLWAGERAVPSNLYRKALIALSEEEQAALQRLTAWLGGQPGTGTQEGGERLVENLEAESHLVGDKAYGNPTEPTAFLRRLAGRFAESPHEDCYEEVCQEFSGKGLRVPRKHLPDTLLRYSTSRALLGLLIEQLLGDQVLADLQQGLLPPEKACELLAAGWDSSQVQEGSLGLTPHVFATFEHVEATPRDDAAALSKALALPFWQRPRTTEEILFELSYQTEAVPDHRFPTVAEAGWHPLFQPAEERLPAESDPRTCFGWTRPVGPDAAQPEIVHRNSPLAVLRASPRWVGRIPL